MSFDNVVKVANRIRQIVGAPLQLIKNKRIKNKEEKARSITEEDSTLEVEKNPRFIAIVSGKGGVGKTTIASNLGAALTMLHKQVVLIDMDLAMPNVEIITESNPPGIILEGYSKENIEKINRFFNEFPLKNNYIILDMPPGREGIEILSNRMEALLVVNPNKAAVLDALNMKALLDKKGVKILGVILNRAEMNDAPWIDEIEKLLETRVVSVIPESRLVNKSLNDEECFVVTSAHSPPSEEIYELAEELFL